MSEYNNQRFYWIRLTDRFMTSDTVDFLMSQPNGSQYVVLYQMLCLKTVNQNGELSRQIGEVIIPYDAEKIQRDLKYFSIDTVIIALDLFKRLGLIFLQENGSLRIADFDKLIGSQTISAEKKQEQRLNAADKRWTRGGQMSAICPPDKEKDKEIDLKEKSVREKKDTPFDEKDYTAFIEKYGIAIDGYSSKLHEMNFKALDAAYQASEYLRTNILSLSFICKEYDRILGGYYKDWKKCGGKTANDRKYTKEELNALIKDADKVEF